VFVQGRSIQQSTALEGCAFISELRGTEEIAPGRAWHNFSGTIYKQLCGERVASELR